MSDLHKDGVEMINHNGYDLRLIPILTHKKGVYIRVIGHIGGDKWFHVQPWCSNEFINDKHAFHSEMGRLWESEMLKAKEWGTKWGTISPDVNVSESENNE